MKRTTLLTIVVAGLTLAACGSDGGGDSGVQDQVAEMTIEQASEAGVTLDEGCVTDVTDQLSDDDASAIVAGNDDDVSEEGSLLSIQIIDCVDE